MASRLIPIALYFLVLFVLGAVASRRVKGMSDFFVAGKRLNFWFVAFSSRATGESGWLLHGLTGMGFAVGMNAMWVVLGEVIGVTLCWVFLVQRFKVLTDRYESITVTDYLEDRFGDTSRVIRVIATVALLIFVTAYVSAQFAACGKAFSAFLGISHATGVIVGVVIVGFYTVAGGFIAVVWSDLFQGSLMLLGLIVLPVVGIAAAGGPSVAFETVAAIDPTLLDIWGPGGFSAKAALGAAGLVAIGLGFLGSPQLFVRFIAVKSPAEFKNGSIIAFLFTFLADMGAVITGVAGRALFTTLKDPETVLPRLAESVLPEFAIGLFMAIVLAAIMSTADSLLVLVSSAVVRDIWQKIFRPDLSDESLTRLCRYVTLAVAGVAVAFAFDPDSVIFWFVLFAWTGITTSFCPAIIISLFWPRATRTGIAAGMLTGIATTIAWKLTLHAVIDEMIVAFTASTVVIVVVSLFTTPPPNAASDLAGARQRVFDIWR